MHTDTTSPKEMPTGDGNPTAGNTDTGTVSNAPVNDKTFAGLKGAFALAGHSLHRTAAEGGTEAFWAERWGLVRYLPTIDKVRHFLEQIGGRV